MRGLERSVRTVVHSATICVLTCGVASGQLVRQSVTATGAQAQSGGRTPVVSADGRHIAFVSNSPDLVANDTNGVNDIFVRHRDTGVVTRVSVKTDGTAGNADSYNPEISADGRYVAFCTASALTTADTNANEDVYLRDLSGTTTILVSTGPGGTASDGGGCSTGLDLSADGRYVAFVSWATNLVASDLKWAEDVFVWDRDTYAIELVSVSSANGAASDRSRGTVSISSDGRYVAFLSNATNLVTPSSTPGQHVFVRDRLARITLQVSVATSGAQANLSSSQVAIAGDGRHVTFSSGASNLDVADTNTDSDVFVHDLATRETTLVSHSRPGIHPSRHALSPSISDDGRFVTFESAEAFVAGAQTDVWHVYLYDLLNRRMRIASGRNDGTLATGPGAVSESSAGAISGDGRYVAFQSWAGLVTGDTNGAADVYMFDAMYWRFQRYPATGSAGRLNTDGTLLSFQYAPPAGTSVSLYADLRGVGRMTTQVQSRPTPPPPRGYQGFPSGDARFVAFVSDAVAVGDTNGVSDVFVWERGTGIGTTTRESVSSTGVLANGRSDSPVLSLDGRYLAFLSAATNLVPNDTNGATDAFVRDRQTGLIQRISVDSTGAAANAGTFGLSISGDGRYVAFASDASNLVAGDTNNRGDVFVHDRQAAQTTRISLTAAGGQAADGSFIGAEAVSVDGRYVAFMSVAALVPEDTNGSLDVYVRDRQANTVSRVSVSSTGAQTAGVSFEGSAIENGNASMSGDGRYVAFQSSSDTLTAGDGNERWDVFVRDRVLGTTTRLDVVSDGLGPGDARVPHVSGDGCCVAFEYTESVPDGTSRRYVLTRERSPVLTGIGPSSVPDTGGTTMTLAGVGFQFGLPTIRIAGINVPGTGDQLTSPTSATFIDPPHLGFTGIADVSVGDASFRSTLARAITIVAAPPPTATLTVQKSGSGAGTVAGGGITCGTTCSVAVPAGTSLTLVASAGVGSTFAGWSEGTCVTTTCDLTLTSNLNLTAAFTAIGLPGDTDGDSLPDVWEQRFGLDSVSNELNDGPEGDPDGDGIGNAAELGANTHPRGTFKRYLAEGASTSFLSTTIAVLNTSDAPASTLFQLLSAGTAPVTVPVTIAAGARYTFDPRSVLGSADIEFSTLVEADRVLVVDRTMTWDSGAYGAHAETSVAAPSPIWYLAEGATHSGFDLFYLLQNPASTATTVRVRYLRTSGAPLEKTYTLPPSSRTNIWVNVEDFAGLGRALASAELSAVLESIDGTPFIVERAMYLSSQGRTFNAGHASMGVTRPASEWFLAEGATGPYFDLFVLIANPSDHDAAVVVTYLLGDGTTYSRTMTAPANSRSGIWVDQEQIDGVPGLPLANVAVSTSVKSTNGVPIIVERAMWWPGDGSTWHEAHNSSGSRTAGTRWALAEGETGGTRQVETYILIANTSAFAGGAGVTLHFEDGTTVSKDYPLAPHSRTNVPVTVDFPSAHNRRFGAVVESTGATPAEIVVERAMYANAAGVQWASGTNALATRLDGIGELALYAAPGDPLILEAFLPDGGLVTFAADKLDDGTPAALRRITTKNPAGGTTLYVLDAAGRPVRATAPNGVVFDFAWQSATEVDVTVTDAPNGTTLTFPVTVPAASAQAQLAEPLVRAAASATLVTAAADTETFGTSDVIVNRCGQPYNEAEVVLHMSGGRLLGGIFGRELSAPRVPGTPGLYRARVPINSSARAAAVGEFCGTVEELVGKYCDLYQAVPNGPVQRIQLYEAVCTQLSVMLAQTAVLAPEAALLFTACQSVIVGSEIACALNEDFSPDGLHQISPGTPSLFEQACKVAAPVTDFFLRGDVRLLPVATVERALYTTEAKESSADGEFNGKFPSFEIKIDAEEATTITSVTPNIVPAYAVSTVTVRGTGLRGAQVGFGFGGKALAIRHAPDGKSMEMDIQTLSPTERIYEERPDLANLAMAVSGKCSGAFARVTTACPPAPVITKLFEPKVIAETPGPFGNRTVVIGFEGKYLSGATGPTGKIAAGITKVEFTRELSHFQDRVLVTLTTECGAVTAFEVFVGAASPGGAP
jgi:Tol biopolymer transport system component